MKIFLNKKLLTTFCSLLVLIMLIVYGNFKLTPKNNYPDLRNKHIVAYVALREEEAKYLLELFKQKTGCTYEYIKLPTEEAVKRILAEKDNPQGNIFIGGTCDAYELLKSYGLLESYRSPSSKNIPEMYKDSENYWTGFEIEPLSIAINKKTWKSQFGEKTNMPKSFLDLKDPIFKNKIILPDPRTSGTGYTLLASLYQQLGEKEFRNFIAQLKNNTTKLTISGFNSIQRVSSGEYTITIDFLGDQQIMRKSDINILTIVPKNVGWNVNAIAAIKNHKNSIESQYFIDFCLSDEVAKKLHLFSMANSTKFVKSVENIIDKDYSFKKAAYERNKIMEIWNSK